MLPACVASPAVESTPHSPFENCHELAPEEFDECILQLLRRVERIEQSGGDVELVRKDRSGDYVIRTYRICWDTFCRDVRLAPSYEPPWWRVWVERAGVFAMGFVVGFGTAQSR